jgi:hypothetical protein
MRKIILQTPKALIKPSNTVLSTPDRQSAIVTRLRKIRTRPAAKNEQPTQDNLPEIPDYGPWTMNHGPWID